MNFNDIKFEEINDSGRLFDILIKIMGKLRSEEGCMWDREQTHQSIKKNLIEEAYEAVESIENNNSENLKEEMGDILLQVVFHSQMAKEASTFNINDVLKTIISKLIRRHPHVFSTTSVVSSREILSNWEDIKKEERKEKLNKNQSIFVNIPKILPALHLAYEIQNRASRFDFDWENPDGVVEKINEEFSEFNEAYEDFKKSGDKKHHDRKSVNDEAVLSKMRGETGDLLFSIVNLCRHLDMDPEQSLKDTCTKFIKRFDHMQEYSEKNNIDFKSLTLEEKDKIWKIAKDNIKM